MLKRQQIYIIPTGRGLLFLGASIVSILTAATYNNNLIFILGFSMFAVFIVALLKTHYNIKGVQLDLVSIGENFSGESIILCFQIKSKRPRLKTNLDLRIRKNKWIHSLPGSRVSLNPKTNSQTCTLQVIVNRRGVHKLPKVILETEYPLGLFISWKVYPFTGELVVYPRPIVRGQAPKVVPDAGSENTGLNNSFDGDFGELRPYRTGESYHQIAWRHFARTKELYSKAHWADDSKHYKIPWLASPGQTPTEDALETMSGWIQQAVQENASFEMETSKRVISPGSGFEQAKICLRELAKVGAA